MGIVCFLTSYLFAQNNFFRTFWRIKVNYFEGRKVFFGGYKKDVDDSGEIGDSEVGAHFECEVVDSNFWEDLSIMKSRRYLK
jgi:hypothetical protein